MNEAPEFVARRLNSIIKQITDIERTGKTPSFDRCEVVWNAYSELHQNIIENIELDDFFPKYTEHNASHSEVLLEKIKTKIRELADYFSLTLDIDQKTQSGPVMAQYQNQVSTQINLQKVDNVIECINSLNLNFEQKTELVKLTKEFEENLNKKDSGKLKSILTKVAEISPKVAGFLLEHASELGQMGLLFGT
jgi:hypothetical protein